MAMAFNGGCGFEWGPNDRSPTRWAADSRWPAGLAGGHCRRIAEGASGAESRLRKFHRRVQCSGISSLGLAGSMVGEPGRNFIAMASEWIGLCIRAHSHS